MPEDRDFSIHHFLIADDQPFVRGLVSRMLGTCKVGSVQEAYSGTSALDALSESKGKIDCVLSDWDMEPINGLQVLSLIRRGVVKGVARDLRIIMLTSHADEALIKLAGGLDANGYLVKPVGLEKLMKAIDLAFTKPFKLKSIEQYTAVKVPMVPSGS